MDKFILEGYFQRFDTVNRNNGRIYPENLIGTYFKRFKRKSKIKSLLGEKY
jgi:hypothetical protein